MTRRALNLFLKATFRFACMLGTLAYAAMAAELPATNHSVSLEAESRQAVLTSAEQVHRLTRAEAASGHRVLIRGVVTCALPAYDAAVVQDATSGIYIDWWNSSLGAPAQMGELVEIEGITDPGQFAPRIHAHRLTRLGNGELPQPVRPYWDQLINGSLDTQYVEIEGIVTTARAAQVTLLTHGGKINAMVFDANDGTNNVTLKPSEDALVRIRGCLFAS